MRSRALCVLSALLLALLVACSGKPADTTSNTASNMAAPANTASGNSGAAMSSPATSASTPAATAPAPAAAPAPPPPPPRVVIPAGTTLTVRLGEAVGSKISSAGDTFSARLASAVVVDGNSVVPAGTKARGTVVSAVPLGKIKGAASLELRLTSLVVNGTEQSISTAAISRTEKGKGKRTAVIGGGGAAFGAIVGGLAGGGKGAAIGALAGGGAGTAGAAYTGNKDIVFPAESALSFRLTAPLQVNPSSAQ